MHAKFIERNSMENSPIICKIKFKNMYSNNILELGVADSQRGATRQHTFVLSTETKPTVFQNCRIPNICQIEILFLMKFIFDQINSKERKPHS